MAATDPLRLQTACIAAIAFLLLSLAPPRAAAQQRPEFEFSFQSCPETLEAAAGRTFHGEHVLTIVTRNLTESDDGAQGWSLSITADGATIVSITTSGTLAAGDDEDPPGLRRDGFERSALADSERGDPVGDILGATSAVVLSFREPITLPPVGTSTIARIAVEGTTPASLGERKAVSVYYLDGLMEGPS